jgi:prepilin-type N-terminal cleavage/methylation domain-containing protein
MNLSPISPRRGGFTLIEMIGVLAIIAILAALLIPRVFTVISSARNTSAGLSVMGIETAAVIYYQKYGKLGNTNGATISTFPFLNWDSAVLMPERLLDKPFSAVIGTSASVQLVAALASTVAPNGTNSAYNLDGNSVFPNDTGDGTAVLEVVFVGVSLAEARQLNTDIDGPAPILGEASAGTDILGRVKYVFASGSQTGDVHIYLAHK